MSRHRRQRRHRPSPGVNVPPYNPPVYTGDAVTVESGSLTTTFRVGTRYRCSIALPLAAACAGLLAIETRWEPDVPSRLTNNELRDYRRGRDMLLAEAANQIGGSVAVVEL
jgi:hypothetical protein